MSQRIHSFTTWTAVVALSALPALAHPSLGAESRVPITDPQLLERMGFAPDATDVYATPQELQQLLMGPNAANTIQEGTEEAPAKGVFGVDDAGETAASGSDDWDTSVFGVGEDIDLEHCTYAVRARLDDENVTSCSEDSDLGILKARANPSPFGPRVAIG